MGDLQQKKRHKEEEGESSDPSPLFNCAHLILPWLTPPELASVSSSCKSLHRLSQSITARRSADAARSLERFPIPFINTVDHTPYAFFIYTPSSLIPNPRFQRQPWGSTGVPVLGSTLGRITAEAGENGYGCGCENRCEGETEEDAPISCPCSFGLEAGEVMNECGPSCGCEPKECGNRVTQGGVSVRVRIVRDKRKGWGLYAADLIPRGQFICEYAGELLTTIEARRRQQTYDGEASSGALLVVREHLPSGTACMRINIDATRVGNVARFINHSCGGGNLATRIVRSSGVLLPRLCFFAAGDIRENEELTFSYGIGRRRLGSRCFCSSSCCSGYLPSENT